MPTRRVVLTLLTLFVGMVVVGCPGVTFTPSPTVIPEPEPSVTPVGVPTVPAPPTVPLAVSRPQLLYVGERDGGEVLVGVDADQQELSTLPLPERSLPTRLADAASPDGRWLAFTTGSAESPSEAGYDLALNLMDLSTGEAWPLTALLSADYPDNFRRAGDMLTQQGITLVEGADPAIVLRDAFVIGIDTLAWSPDGRYLAFAGQMDGLSSDVYVYEVESGTIRRLSDDLEQVQSITWSPDSRWVMCGGVYWMGAGADIHYRATTVDGSVTTVLPGGLLTIQGWLDPTTVLQSRVDRGAYQLQSISLEDGAVRTLWEGAFTSWAVDPANDVLAIVGSESVGSLTQPAPSALYLVSLADGSVRAVGEAASVAFLGAWQRRFLVNSYGESAFVMADGSLSESFFDEGEEVMGVSPDLRMVATAADALRVYAWGNVLLREVALPSAEPVDRVIWRADVPGLFVLAGSALYAVDPLGGEPWLVSDHAPNEWAFDYRVLSPGEIGPEAAWDSPAEFSDAFQSCLDSPAEPGACMVATMSNLGAPEPAVVFARLLFGEGFMLEFEEQGRVDVARVLYHPRPSDIYGIVLLNGTPRVVYAGEDLGSVDITQDPLYATLHQRYPNLTIWESLHNFVGVESLPEGGQRFTIRYDLVDGCHICRTGSTALVAFDFDPSGQFLGTELLRLEE